MKKKICIVICIIALIIVAGIIINKVNTIQLTIENYDKYLEITPRIQGLQDIKFSYFAANADYYDNIRLSTHVNGVSDNYEYKDIKVEVEFLGELKRKNGKTEIISKIITIDNCNIVGKGSKTIEYYDESINSSEELLFLEEMFSNGNENDDITAKIISVSGTLTPVK